MSILIMNQKLKKLGLTYNTALISFFQRKLSSVSSIKNLNASRTKFPIKRSKTTLSYANCPSSTPLIGLTIGQVLDQTTEKFPDRECLVFCKPGIRRTFSEFLEEVYLFASGLLKLGYKKGDRLGVWGPSTLEWVITQFATAKIGVILVNINPAYQTAELEYALRKVGCRGVVAASNFKKQNYYEIICELAPKISECGPGATKSKRLPDLSDVIMMGDNKLPGTYKFSDIMTLGRELEAGRIQDLQRRLQFDDPINIQFTSGTTGSPKGATLSHHNIVNNALMFGKRLGLHIDVERILCQVPLYHCFGMVGGLLSMGIYGATNVFPEPGYSPSASIKSLADERCTILFGTPTMYIDILSHAENGNFHFPYLKKGVMAGSPCPVEVIVKAEEKLEATIHIAYGSTETSPVVTLMEHDDPLAKRITTVGRTLDHIENKIVNSSGDVVPVNTAGEILNRGFCVMQKYWGDEEKTRKSIDENGWYHTGDLAMMDEDGYLKIVGRIKDMIIRGGENIYPTEIEDVIHKFSKVDDVQVFGLPDSRLGEIVAAWIRLNANETSSAEEIKEFCKGKLSYFKIPEHIKFVDEFPLTVTRKVQKFKMREIFSKELGLSE